jgi:translation initiation factor IF-3
VDKIKELNLKRNEEIRVPKVRLVDENGQMIGIMPTNKALDIAREKGLDLVLVSPNTDPPVAKIMDFGKYRYEATKKSKEAKSKQKKTQLKQMKFRPKIDVHDYQTKLKHLRRFLEEGHKVRVTIMFKGREMAFTDKGKEILEKVANDLKDIAEVEGSPRLEGRDMWLNLRPKSQKN